MELGRYWHIGDELLDLILGSRFGGKLLGPQEGHEQQHDPHKDQYQAHCTQDKQDRAGPAWGFLPTFLQRRNTCPFVRPNLRHSAANGHPVAWA
jgi:hypothetical protein